MCGNSRWIAMLAVAAAFAFTPRVAAAQVFFPRSVVTTQWSPAPVQVVQPAFFAPAPVTTVTHRYGPFGRRRRTVVTQRPVAFAQAPVFVPAPVVTTSGFWAPQPVFIR